MTDISNIDVPEGTDELSRSTRRAWRDRLNDAQARKMIVGMLATLLAARFGASRAPVRASCSMPTMSIHCGL